MAQRRVLPVLLSALALAASSLCVAGSADAAPARHTPGLSWRVTPTGVPDTVRFRGLAAVSRSVAWAGGFEGVVLRTVDGGRTWASVGPAGAAGLQFRDIEATSAMHAVAMSAGEGEDSRIYVTDDGGASWVESFRNHEPTAFYDCMAFSSPKRGLAVSDPVDGKARLIRTSDGGHTWSIVDQAGMPPALVGEYYFAGSGTCLSALPGQQVALGTGGAGPWARVLVSTNRGRSWTVAETPVAASASSGIFSVRFRDRRQGLVVGGDYAQPDNNVANAAWTADGGRTWHLPAVTPRGYRSGAAWLPQQWAAAIAVGPTGSDVTWDGGRSWAGFDDGSFDTVQCADDGACWASGAGGRIAVLDLAHR
jgi:photosystem II stability/assembly factor-like uncharacterized protein